MLATAAPVLLLGAVGWVALRPDAGTDAGVAASDQVTALSAPVRNAAGRAAALPPVEELGIRRGTLTIHAPASVPRGSVVRFVLAGPDRWSKGDRRPPHVVSVDTRRLDNGAYTLTVTAVRDGVETVVRRGKLKIRNRTVPAPTRTTTPPSATPTRPPAPSDPPTSSTTRPPSPTRTTPPAPTTTAPPPPAGGSYADQVVTLTNAQRASNGCGALKVNATLTRVAQAHSEDMAKNNYFSHTSQDGRSPFQRMSDAGYQYRGAAENIAAGQRTPQDVVTGWMNSAGHRANILNCGLTEIGVGYAEGGSYGRYWTQNFGTPR